MHVHGFSITLVVPIHGTISDFFCFGKFIMLWL